MNKLAQQLRNPKVLAAIGAGVVLLLILRSRSGAGGGDQAAASPDGYDTAAGTASEPYGSASTYSDPSGFVGGLGEEVSTSLGNVATALQGFTTANEELTNQIAQAQYASQVVPAAEAAPAAVAETGQAAAAGAVAQAKTTTTASKPSQAMVDRVKARKIAETKAKNEKKAAMVERVKKRTIAQRTSSGLVATKGTATVSHLPQRKSPSSKPGNAAGPRPSAKKKSPSTPHKKR